MISGAFASLEDSGVFEPRHRDRRCRRPSPRRGPSGARISRRTCARTSRRCTARACLGRMVKGRAVQRRRGHEMTSRSPRQRDHAQDGGRDLSGHRRQDAPGVRHRREEEGRRSTSTIRSGGKYIVLAPDAKTCDRAARAPSSRPCPYTHEHVTRDKQGDEVRHGPRSASGLGRSSSDGKEVSDGQGRVENPLRQGGGVTRTAR
jgi:hypothetical protein